jgi:ribosomal protein L37AE/L43A
MNVVCGSCGEHAAIQAPSDVWLCLGCGATNEQPGTEDNPPDVSDEADLLRARLAELEAQR